MTQQDEAAGLAAGAAATGQASRPSSNSTTAAAAPATTSTTTTADTDTSTVGARSSAAAPSQQHHTHDLDATTTSSSATKCDLSNTDANISNAKHHEHNPDTRDIRPDDFKYSSSSSQSTERKLGSTIQSHLSPSHHAPLRPVSPKPPPQDEAASGQIPAASHIEKQQQRRDQSAPSATTFSPDDQQYPPSAVDQDQAEPQAALTHASTWDSAESRTRESSLSAGSLPDRSSRESFQHQRDLLLPRTNSQTSPPDERRVSHRPPPVSYKPPAGSGSTPISSGPTTPVRVPPIRGFRSSGSRKSLNLDMNFKGRNFDFGDDVADPTHDRTLRALEGRRDQDLGQMTPPASARYSRTDGDDNGDLFLKIAREEGYRRAAEEYGSEETRGAYSRTLRSSHRRPMSTYTASYNPTSPPRLTRRLSDQQDTVPSRRYDDQSSEVSRATTYRSLARDKAASAHPGEDTVRQRYGPSALRPSPLTLRTYGAQEAGSEEQPYSRRRPSVTDSNSGTPARHSSHRSGGMSGVHSKAYSSSPLTRSFDLQSSHPSESAPQHGVEGTDSTASNAAPSTMWDELDDLKSRIHRLELTGKLPSTSGAAVSRLSDDRPPTATTTATTMSSSPKRAGGGAGVSGGSVAPAAPAAPATEAASATSTQKEHHPLLVSALAKSKPFINPEVFRALESAAHDAMSLSSMMGVAGQPGPISSGASTIGSGATVTDRQLRRKADGVCRGLTELCIALGEDVVHQKTAQAAATQAASEVQTEASGATLTASNSFAGVPAPRRSSITAADQTLPQSLSSPKVMSKFEERRNHVLTGSALPSSRGSASTPSTPKESTPGRRSSLLISRTRRAATEEPEEQKPSSYLNSRRAGTEEPEEGRKTSFLVRNRHDAGAEADMEEPRYRTTSRATTEVHSTRGPAREYHTQAQVAAPEPAQPQSSAPVQSALPRRRFVSTTQTPSRLAMPGGSSIATPARNYLDRSTERAPAGADADRSAESRPSQRYLSLGQSRMPERAASQSIRRTNRDSTITMSSTAASAGNYR